MQAYVDPDQSATLDDWAFSLAFAQDQASYAFPVAPMQPCKNLACANSSYAVFCSEACRLLCEPEEGDYYADPDDSDILLGCKAVADTQHAADLAAGGFAAMVCGVQPQTAAPVAMAPTFSEAPISITLKGLRQGVDTMITIRGTDLQSVQVQLTVASAWFDAPAAQPAPSTPVETGEHFCQLHHVTLRFNKAKPGQGKDWYSHKLADGSWCKGKGRTAA